MVDSGRETSVAARSLSGATLRPGGRRVVPANVKEMVNRCAISVKLDVKPDMQFLVSGPKASIEVAARTRSTGVGHQQRVTLGRCRLIV